MNALPLCRNRIRRFLEPIEAANWNIPPEAVWLHVAFLLGVIAGRLLGVR